ncbi:MAG: ferritin-like domain-containing protein [Cystobacter sp.]
MNPSRLRKVFAHTLRASLTAPLVLAGCEVRPSPVEAAQPPVKKAPTTNTPGINLSGYNPIECGELGLSVKGLSPEQPTDLVQLWRLSEYGPRRSTNDGSRRTQISSTGEACATATDRPACETALARLTPEQSFRKTCEHLCVSYYLATTRGDEVTAHTTLAALKGYLGRIDTPQEAVLLAFAHNIDLPCGEKQHGGVKPLPSGGYSVVGTQGHTCGANTKVEQVVLEVSPSGDVREAQRLLLAKGDPHCAIGRRPEGMHASEPVNCDGALGRYYAEAAHLEAASIRSFLRLYEELSLHGAEAALLDAALSSAADEVMHTEASTHLARRFGATPPSLHVEERTPRSLFELALENVVEGCTRETYGALMAQHQALHAQDAEIRAVMAGIAEDETRHAELSWAVDHWAQTRLNDTERATLHEARRQAVHTLREEMTRPQDERLITQAGLPSPEVAAGYLSSLEHELWA